MELPRSLGRARRWNFDVLIGNFNLTNTRCIVVIMILIDLKHFYKNCLSSMGHRERTEARISKKESKIFANLLQEAEQEDTEKI